MKIRTLEPIVQEVLEQNESARKDDFILLAEVIEKLGIDTRISFRSILLFHNEFQVPSFESITRCRRKLQELHPELKDEETAMFREEKVEEFIQYALNIGDENE